MSESDVKVRELVDKVSQLELKLQSIDEAPLGITIADMRQDDNPLIYANDGFKTITGYTREEILGQNCRFLQGEQTDDEPVTRMREAIDAGESVRVELRNYRRNGGQFWSEVTLAPLHSESGKITHYVGFQQDISTRKEYEQQLEQQRDDLSVLNKMVRHDIRNDLQVALASMELLQADGTDNEQVTTAIESIQQAIELTNVAREVADVMLDTDTSYHPVELRSLLYEEIKDTREAASEATITVTGTIPAVHVRANELLGSVFRNLLRNAVGHNDADEPVVRVSVTTDNSSVRIAIADNGPGIPDADREQVFERGWTSSDDGTGMGLYIVRRLVENYGGTISHTEEAKDRMDLGGATFVVELPTVDN